MAKEIFDSNMENILLAKENGFNSIESMKKAHKPILELSCDVLSKEGGNVLDLGCGNGYLLKTLREHCPNIIPYGIEQNLSVVAHAKTLQPEFLNNFFQGNLFNASEILPNDQNFELIIIMPGRFLELNDENKKTELLDWLNISSKKILAYVYKDWSKEFKNFKNILDKAGFEIIQKNKNDSIAIVKVKK